MKETIEESRAKIAKMQDGLLNADGLPDLERVIADFGLIPDPTPTIYGHYNKASNADREDLGIYQTPYQFAQLLRFICDSFPADIQSYCEIGVFRGGTFLFMKSWLEELYDETVEFTAVEPNPAFIHPAALEIIEPYLIVGTSENIKGRAFDIVFIDGDHSYQWIKKDWENVGRYARKLCIFHDIIEPTCPDVVRFWREVIRPNYQTIEFTHPTYQAKGVTETQGIGIVIM